MARSFRQRIILAFVLAGLASMAGFASSRSQAENSDAECRRRCMATNSTRSAFNPSNNECDCRCGENFARDPGPVCTRQNRCDPGSAEWRRDAPACREIGIQALRQVQSVFNREAQNLSGNLAIHALQACAQFEQRIAERNLCGCTNTCGRILCDALMRNYSNYIGGQPPKSDHRSFNSVSRHAVLTPSGCD